MAGLADLLSLGAPPALQSSIAAAMPRGLQFNIPQAPPQQSAPMQQQSPIHRFLDNIGDAFLVASGGQPLHRMHRMEQQQTQALSGFLTNPDDAIAKLMQVNPTLGIELYRGAHPPSEKTMEQKVFEYEQSLDPSQRPAFEKSIALTHPGMMAPVTLGPNDTVEGGSGQPTAGMPYAATPEDAKKYPPGTLVNTPYGVKKVPGGATASTPSPTFSR